MLLVAAAVAGEPISLASGATQVAGGIGGALNGMTDPSEVGASGRLSEDDRIGEDLLENADDLDKLLKLGQGAPSGNLGINGTMLEAYMRAAETLGTAQPGCNLHWSLLASIGRIESNHARGGRLDAEGNTVPQILGPVLNGGGFAAIRDTDGGAYDGDARWDRAVGAMQFIPSTWKGYAADGNGDGLKSPHNVYDATVAAGKYLCSGGLDMSKPQDRATAVFRYNHSDSYVATVLSWADAYANGVDPMPSDPVWPDEDDNLALGPPSIGNQPPRQDPPPNTPNTPPANTPGPTPGTTTPSTPTTPPCVPATPPTTTTPPTSSTTTPSTPTTTMPACEVTRPSTPLPSPSAPLTPRPSSSTPVGSSAAGTSPDGGPSSSSSASAADSSSADAVSSSSDSVVSSSSAEPTP